jgi:hypothetical protein
VERKTVLISPGASSVVYGCFAFHPRTYRPGSKILGGFPMVRSGDCGLDIVPKLHGAGTVQPSTDVSAPNNGLFFTDSRRNRTGFAFARERELGPFVTKHRFGSADRSLRALRLATFCGRLTHAPISLRIAVPADAT